MDNLNNKEPAASRSAAGSESAAPQPGGVAASRSANPFVTRQRDPGMHNGVPLEVVDGPEWAARCNASAPFVSQRRDAQERFEKYVDQRIALLQPFEYRLAPEWDMDFTYARWRREVPYVHALADLLVWPELETCLMVDTRIVIRPPPQSANRWFKSYMDRGLARSRRLDKEWVMPLDARELERRERKRTGCLVPGHCTEVVAVKRAHVGRRYVPLPWWWREVEVPYNMRPELPPCVSYIGRRLAQNAAHPAWKIVRSEWAVQIAMDLMVQARFGRLYGIPIQVRRDLRDLDLDYIFGESPRSIGWTYTRSSTMLTSCVSPGVLRGIASACLTRPTSRPSTSLEISSTSTWTVGSWIYPTSCAFPVTRTGTWSKKWTSVVRRRACTPTA